LASNRTSTPFDRRPRSLARLTCASTLPPKPARLRTSTAIHVERAFEEEATEHCLLEHGGCAEASPDADVALLPSVFLGFVEET
jgi:hypothetical protein